MEEVLRASTLLRDADCILLLTGAGMSADSGLSTYTGSQRRANMWVNDDGEDLFALHGTTYASMASPEALVDDPRLAWGFHSSMVKGYAHAEPHEGYRIANRLLDGKRTSFVVTSNVDRYHQRSGWSEDKLYEVHGAEGRLQCADPCEPWQLWDDVHSMSLTQDAKTGRIEGPLPSCPQCGGLARPNVCLFRDVLWVPTVAREQRARLEEFIEKAKADHLKTVILEVGAGRAITTIRHFGSTWAKELNAKVIRINLDDAALEDSCPPGSVGISMGALQALKAIEEALKMNSL